MEKSLEHIGTWHKLLDELCHHRGFSDNMSLAARHCELTSGRGQKHFDTALRNLNNWRAGRHLPRPRSARVLARLLEIEDDLSLMKQWDCLYEQARTADNFTGEKPAEMRFAVSEPRTKKAYGQAIVLTLTGAGLFLLGIAVGVAWDTEWRPWRTEADNAPLITYLPEVRLVVGQSRIIHGERGDCGRLPRDWRDVWGNLPSSRIGDFSDAGIVRRYSMFCKGATPARGVRFTAKAPGTEEMYVIGDYMKITVVDEGSLTIVGPEGNETEHQP